jgi:hypothetical protein
MASPEAGQLLICRVATLLLVLAGCADNAESPDRGTVGNGSLEGTRAKSAVPSRDSIVAAFLKQPDVILGQMNPKTAPVDVYIAATLLQSAQGEAKLRFAHYLVKQGERGVPEMLSIVRDSDDWKTLVPAIQALGKSGSPAAVSVISRKLKTPNDWVRIAVAHALGDIGGEPVLPWLVSALQDTSDTVVSAALIAIGKSEVQAAVSDCVGHLTHQNPRVRASAVSAISRLGSENQIKTLKPMLNDPDSGVRFKAQQGIERLLSSAERLTP